jgi:hypothetical protein
MNYLIIIKIKKVKYKKYLVLNIKYLLEYDLKKLICKI